MFTMKALVCLSVALGCFVSWTEADGQTRPKWSRRVQLRPGRGSAEPGTDVQADMGASGPGWRAGGLGLLSRRRGAAGELGLPRRPDTLQEDGGAPGARARVRVSPAPSSAGSPNLLASFAGKNRLLVISAPHEADGYYRLMMSLLRPDVYCELAERHVHQIVMFHQEGGAGGKVRRITAEGKVLEEPLDTALIPRFMSLLKLETGKFGMVLLKKTLQVEERYPYPVRLEAMYEVIDQSPMRKLEKLRQRGFVQKCKKAGVEGQVEEGTLTEYARQLMELVWQMRLEFPSYEDSLVPETVVPPVTSSLEKVVKTEAIAAYKSRFNNTQLM